MKVTFQQGKGKFNKDYYTCIFWFEKEDKHFFLRKDKEKCNYMPKHNEITLMIKSCLEVEPLNKREKLKEMWIKAIDEAFESEVKYNK